MKPPPMAYKTMFSALWMALLFIIPALGSPNPLPQPAPNHLSNADLHHLLSLLDDNEPESGHPPVNHAIILDDLDVGASETLSVQAEKSENILPTIATSATAATVSSAPRKKLIRRRKTTTTPKPTEASLTAAVSSTTTLEPLPSLDNIIKESEISDFVNQSIERRQDNHIENLKAIAPPSQQELVQQLALLNSLLTSLGDNATLASMSFNVSNSNADSHSSASNLNEVLFSSDRSSPNTTSSNTAHATKKVDDQQAATLQSLALLNSLFGGSLGGGGPTSSDQDATAAANALFGLRMTGSAPQANVNTPSEAQAAALLSLIQSASLASPNQQSNGLGNLQNFQNTNANLDAAASNQISGLLSLLGTLGSLGQPQQQTNSLFNLAQSSPAQTDQNVFLANLLGGSQQPQAQANALGNLFGSASQPQGQAFNFGNLFAPQNPTAAAIPGLGLLTTMGTLGSSLFSTVSNMLGGGGFGGKPRVRGKGVDTRLGLGYRLGDAADAQIVWDIGPQLFTDPLRNEPRSPTMKKKSDQVYDSSHQLLNTQARAEKQQQQMAATKRLLQLQFQNEMKNQYLKQTPFARFTTKKPLSLLDMWNSGKSDQAQSASLQLPKQLLHPPSFFGQKHPLHPMRIKSFMKRSSGPDELNFKPFYSKPMDDPLSGHSTLTNYEKKLLELGNAYGQVDQKKKSQKQNIPAENEGDEIYHGSKITPSPTFSAFISGRPKSRRVFRPRPNQHGPMRNRGHSKERNSNGQHQFSEDNSLPYLRNQRPDNEPKESSSKQYEVKTNFENQFGNWKDVSDGRERHRKRPSSSVGFRESGEPSQYNNRPRPQMYSDVDKENMHASRRPSERQEQKRSKNPFWALRNFFYPRPSQNSNKRRRPAPQKEANRRYDSLSSFDGFTNVDEEMMMDDSKRDERFEARNRNRDPSPFKQSQGSFVRKHSRLESRMHERFQDYSTPAATNPESDDSFIRRNAVVTNPLLKEMEKQKLLHQMQQQEIESSRNSSTSSSPKSTSLHNIDLNHEHSPHSNSVLTMIKNFLSSKSHPRKSSNHTSRPLHSLISDASPFNLLKVLPMRRTKKPSMFSGGKTKLTMVDGKPKIVPMTDEPLEKATAKPEVHVGEDMSFEDLTKLFPGGGAQNASSTKRKKKVKGKKTQKNKIARQDEDMELSRDEESRKAQIKDDKAAKDDEEDYIDDDGLKGIFIDIDSGEVNVMKPVASLTSFEPKKESEEEVDEYEDNDGDGVPDADTQRKQAIFEEIQKELKRNYEKMKKAQQRAEAKKRRKEELVSKGMDESVDVISKYFDMIEDSGDSKKNKHVLLSKGKLHKN